jgi:hypothetical protein
LTTFRRIVINIAQIFQVLLMCIVTIGGGVWGYTIGYTYDLSLGVNHSIADARIYGLVLGLVVGFIIAAIAAAVFFILVQIERNTRSPVFDAKASNLLGVDNRIEPTFTGQASL